MKRPEQSIHRAVFQHLAARPQLNVFGFHVPNGGYRSPVEAKVLAGLGVVAGIPDLLIIKDGHVHCLELKAPGGRLSPAQVLAHTRLRLAGASVATAAGLDAAIAQLESWGLLRGVASLRTEDDYPGKEFGLPRVGGA
jgi:hypothetical protein